MNLITALGVRAGDVVARVGGGGKSSLLFALGEGFDGRSVLTTTTRLGAEQCGRARRWLTLAQIAADENALGTALAEVNSCLVTAEIVAAPDGNKALGVDVAWPRRLLARADVELVVVEADGAKRRPVKAPGPHEPALPSEVSLVVVVAGVDGLAGPIAAVAHRPERVAHLTGLGQAQPLTAEGLARLLTHEQGGLKDVAAAARVVVCLNKVETAAQAAVARRVGEMVMASGRVERVVLTTLQPEPHVRGIISSQGS